MKKKILCTCAILAITSTSMISFANETSNEDTSLTIQNEQYSTRQQAAYSTGSNVNIRTKASLSGSVVHKLQKNEAFMLTNDPPKKADGYTWVYGWCRNHPSNSGWVATANLRFD